jgi:hypothetical protein
MTLFGRFFKSITYFRVITFRRRRGMNVRDSYGVSQNVCGTPLVFAGQVWHRVIINKEPPMRVSRDLGLSKPQITGIVRVLRHFGHVPSRERMAVMAMRIPDVTNEDVAEWFGKDLKWAAWVRDKQDYFRLKEPMPSAYEIVEDGYEDGDPTPAEIDVLKQSIRAATERQPTPPPAVGIAAYSWNGRRNAFVPIGVD